MDPSDIEDMEFWLIRDLQGPRDDLLFLRFQELILEYARSCSRDLPWRRTTDPYRILLSEIMLQQTRVETVLPRYQRFLEVCPDLAHLARSPLEEVLSLWKGLGYNRRALSLHRLARQVMWDHGGEIPRSRHELVRLPGIGHATASAIRAYAWNEPEVFLETNIRRVYLHFYYPSGVRVKDADLRPLVEQTLYRQNPRQWYNALMDYGSWLNTRAVPSHRRSASYARQTQFQGSRRQLRGRILAHLLRSGEVPVETLYQELSEDRERVDRALAGLIDEGFVCRNHGRVRIAGNSNQDSD